MTDQRINFPFDTLQAAGDRIRPLDVCNLGHLRVSGRTCWQPVAFESRLHGIICEPARQHD